MSSAVRGSGKLVAAAEKGNHAESDSLLVAAPPQGNGLPALDMVVLPVFDRSSCQSQPFNPRLSSLTGFFLQLVDKSMDVDDSTPERLDAELDKKLEESQLRD